MKIKINSSASITLDEALKDVDFSYGFTMYNDKRQRTQRFTDDKSFALKMLAKIDNFLGVSKESQEFTDTIARATQHLNNTLGQEVLEHTSVQLNNKSTITEMLRDFGILSRTLDPHKAHVHLGQKQIVMGPDFTKYHSASQKLIEKYDAKKMYEQTLFHEFAHTMELHFYDKKEFHLSEIIHGVLTRIHDYNQPPYIERINNKLKETQKEDFFKVDERLFKELCSLRAEIYADIGAVLLERNYDLEKGVYHVEKFKQYIEDVKTYRNDEHASVKKTVTSETPKQIEKYLTTINHLSTFGMDGLFDRIKEFGDKPLNESEINKIAHQSIDQGMARALLTLYHLNDNTEKQMKRFINCFLNSKNEFVNMSENLNHEPIILNKLKACAGENWSKSLEEHVVKTNSSEDSEIDKMQSIFNHALKSTNATPLLNPTYMDKVMAIPELKEAMIEHLVSSETVKSEKLLKLEKKHGVSEQEPPSIAHNITSIIETMPMPFAEDKTDDIRSNNSTMPTDLKSRIAMIRNKTMPQADTLNKPKLKM